MSGFDYRPAPVWVGVAIRLANGTVQAFEMDGTHDLLTVEVSPIEPDCRDLSFGDPHRIYLPSPRLRIQLEGGYTVWRRFDESTASQPSSPTAEVEGGRALPAGDGGA